MYSSRITDVPWSAKDAVVVFVLAWIGLPVVLLLTMYQLALYIPQVEQFMILVDQKNILATLAFLVLDSLAGLAVLLYYLRRYGASVKDLGLRGFDIAAAIGWVLLTGLLFIVSIPLIFELIQTFFPMFNPAEEQVTDFVKPDNAENLRVSFLALVLLPAVVEEVIFRGFIFPGLSSHFGIWGGAILSSLLFGFAHLQLNVMVYTIVLGLLLCLMYRRFGSIWPGIILHMLNNYLAFIALTT